MEEEEKQKNREWNANFEHYALCTLLGLIGVAPFAYLGVVLYQQFAP